jgi:hypothetical protein
MNVTRTCALITLACGIVTAAWPAWSSEAQPVPRTIETARVTCAELLALPNERRDQALIYFNGYLNGVRQTTTWDERMEGERIDRVIADCTANPERPVLDAFARAWGR